MRLRMTKEGRYQTVFEVVAWPLVWLVYLYVPDPEGGWNAVIRPLLYASPFVFTWNVIKRFRAGAAEAGKK